jgi:hypothetical protein
MYLEWNDAYNELCQETGKPIQDFSLVTARLNEKFNKLCEELNNSDLVCSSECLTSRN